MAEEPTDKTAEGTRESSADLLTELVARARAAGFHVMIADIEAGNAGSIRLHERLGFEVCGTVRQVGTKYGRWLDITIMQLVLDPGQDPPAA